APLIFAAYAAHVGIGWTPLLAIPGIMLLWGILRHVPDVRLAHEGSGAGGFRALKPYATPLAVLWALVVIRTIVAIGFSTFLPVLMTRRGLSVSEAGFAVTCYLLAGSFGGLLGGPLADRFGARPVIAWTLALAAPLLVLASSVSGPLAYILLAAGGLFLGSTLPVNISYAHTIAPVSAGTVSSLMLGVAWGVGGMTVPLVGVAADAIGLGTALRLLAVMPVAAALLTLALPATPRHTASGEPVEV
ncbi:MAG: MFS transporter, partial [Bacteroidales bacterium]